MLKIYKDIGGSCTCTRAVSNLAITFLGYETHFIVCVGIKM